MAMSWDKGARPARHDKPMIDLEISEGVAFITVNAPATRNALNNELAGQFVAACDAADRDASVGAAVIRGAGGTFCSGAERGHLDDVGRDPAEERRYASLGVPHFFRSAPYFPPGGTYFSSQPNTSRCQ